ncbi:MAG: polyprenyl synthetase family protein [Dehalococcoidales bacterium]|nr:polyprenyl synthetase family protein [Dehalococcoidales bacterium]
MKDIIYGPVSQDLERVKNKLCSFSPAGITNFPDSEKMLGQILGGGKLLRPLLVLHSGSFYTYLPEKLLPMATSAEMLHVATLVHDDAIDKADTRRGKPTINSIWGSDKAIVLGDYLFACAAEFAAETESLRAVKLFAGALASISTGELRQSFSAFNMVQGYDQYLKRIIGKTASLFAMATETGAALSGAPEESVQVLKDYGMNLGIAFQIMDDVLDFTGTEEELGKPVASDLLQGTVTLPSLKILERYPGDNPVTRLFEKKGNVANNIAEAISLVKTTPILEECIETALGYSRTACKGLEALPANPSKESLYALADSMVKRRN